ncbi:MAG TPA: SpoIID/LytB domain-containing protein [Solirubrobacteraceae bacterium]|nr:SpoIID/LytB domain-containing protein [Solirubrobacteraceae bacterium]
MCASSVGSLAASASAATLVVDGAGDGHGVGMSQDGALGFAEHGWTYSAILAHYYTGTALGAPPANTVVKVLVGSKVKSLPLETYVRGVVSAEMSASWPMAALEAQAVASRTYAIASDAGGAKFDVYSDDRSQVYLGKAAETSRTNSAVAATAGQIVTYAGKPAVTYFFAGSGGQTESVQNAFPGAEPEPWLVSVADPYEAGPLHHWSMTLSFASVSSRLSGLVKGVFTGIEVSKRGVSPRIVSAYVLGSKGRTLVSGPELEARLGLYSTWAYFSVKSAKGTRAEPDTSGQSPAPAPTAQPADVGGTGGSAAAAGTPSGKPGGVDGQGGVPAG